MANKATGSPLPAAMKASPAGAIASGTTANQQAQPTMQTMGAPAPQASATSALTPGMQAANAWKPGGGTSQSVLGQAANPAGTFFSSAPVSNFFSNVLGTNNRAPIGDIWGALQAGNPVSDASWAQAGYGPGGAALNGSGGTMSAPAPFAQPRMANQAPSGPPAWAQMGGNQATRQHPGQAPSHGWVNQGPRREDGMFERPGFTPRPPPTPEQIAAHQAARPQAPVSPISPPPTRQSTPPGAQFGSQSPQLGRDQQAMARALMRGYGG